MQSKAGRIRTVGWWPGHVGIAVSHDWVVKGRARPGGDIAARLAGGGGVSHVASSAKWTAPRLRGASQGQEEAALAGGEGARTRGGLGRPQGSRSRQEGSRLLENLGFYCEDIQESHDVTSFWQYSWGCWDWRRL